MTKEQLEIIVGLIAGVQTAVVHMVSVLDTKGVAAKGEMADSFRGTAASVPPSVPSQAVIAMVLNQIASGIDQSGTHDESVAAIRKLLH